MANIAFIIDGRKKNKNQMFQSFEQSFGQAHQLKKFFTEYAGHAILLAEQALNEGFTHIICVGGDGCLHEVVNGMMKARTAMGEEQWSRIRLGVLPKGSGNDFVKTVLVPEDPDGLKKAVEADHSKRIDLCEARFESFSGGEQNRYLVNIADVGMGAVVVEKQSVYSKRMNALFNYQRAILGTFFTYKKKPLRVTADTFTYEGIVVDFVIANGKYYGNGLGIAPDAVIDDGVFSVTAIGDVSLFDYLKKLSVVRKCKKPDLPELKYYTARELSLESLSGKIPFEIDGEFVGFTPIKIRVVPAAIKVICRQPVRD
ncbi:MAG TPA: diacylglycerol kinase family lipid kinase [Bacteroidales bacterium]|nr:diacylglycerol kinase family lipid kinase [Bacteroidales bacterium]